MRTCILRWRIFLLTAPSLQGAVHAYKTASAEKAGTFLVPQINPTQNETPQKDVANRPVDLEHLLVVLPQIKPWYPSLWFSSPVWVVEIAHPQHGCRCPSYLENPQAVLHVLDCQPSPPLVGTSAVQLLQGGRDPQASNTVPTPQVSLTRTCPDFGPGRTPFYQWSQHT